MLVPVLAAAAVVVLVFILSAVHAVSHYAGGLKSHPLVRKRCP
jgi:hypothetical protein